MGRMHWGKAGWQKWASCFDGSTEYPASWCDFGCAVQAKPLATKITCCSYSFACDLIALQRVYLSYLRSASVVVCVCVLADKVWRLA